MYMVYTLKVTFFASETKIYCNTHSTVQYFSRGQWGNGEMGCGLASFPDYKFWNETTVWCSNDASEI